MEAKLLEQHLELKILSGTRMFISTAHEHAYLGDHAPGLCFTIMGLMRVHHAKKHWELSALPKSRVKKR